MAKICENCGRKNNFLVGDPFSLDNERILCCKCAEKILHELFILESVQTLEDAMLSKEKLIKICYSQFNSNISQLVLKKVEPIYNERYKYFQSIHDKKADLERSRRMIQDHMLTTGFSFDGYYISKYLGIISGQVVLGTGFLSEVSASFSDFLGEEANVFSEKLEIAKNAAISRIIRKSVEKGGNAIIGIDFDYIVFQNNMIGVVANGTSVMIEYAKPFKDTQ